MEKFYEKFVIQMSIRLEDTLWLITGFNVMNMNPTRGNLL